LAREQTAVVRILGFLSGLYDPDLHAKQVSGGTPVGEGR
jgi:hypothetical protein